MVLSMFSIREKRAIAESIQALLRSTMHPELPEGEITFVLLVSGKEPWSWGQICNNGAVNLPDSNPHNERQDRGKEIK